MHLKNKGSTFFYVIMMLCLVGIVVSTMSNLVLFDMKAAREQRKKLQDYYTPYTICEGLAKAVIKNENPLVLDFQEKYSKLEAEAKPDETPEGTPPVVTVAPAAFTATGETTLPDGKVTVTTTMTIDEHVLKDPVPKYVTISVQYEKIKITVKLGTLDGFNSTAVIWKELSYYEEQI